MTPESLSAVVSTLRAAGCVFAEDEAVLVTSTAGSQADLDDMVARRVDGQPLEHIVGFAEFCGLRVEVDPGVFVPRQRTEFLVRQAVRYAKLLTGCPRVLDLCCGSGAIGMAIATQVEIDLYASDVEPAAVRSARRNIEPIGGRVYEGNLFQPLPDRLRGHVDILVVNAPYVPTESIAMMPPEARLYEPQVALDGGSDGLDVQRLVISQAPLWLSPAGRLLIETSDGQAPQTAEAMRRSGLTAEITSSDEFYATVVVGTPASSAL